MSPLRAHVRNGRLVLDEPTDLPEGSILDLVPADPWDGVDHADRQAIHEMLSRSAADAAAGRVVPADQLLKKLRERR